MDPDIGDVGVSVSANFAGFEAKLQAGLRKMARKLKIDIEPEINTAPATAKLAAWRKMQSKALNIRVGIQKKSLALVGKQLGSLTGVFQITGGFMHFNNLLMMIHENIFKIGGIGSLIGASAAGLTTLLSSLTIGVVNLSTALGKGLGAALLALPGLYAAAAISALTFKLAMKDAEKVLGKSLTQYKDLQKVISQNFWKKAEKQVRSLLDNSFEPLKKGLSELSQATGAFTGQLAAELEKVLTPGVIDEFFTNLVTAFDNLTKSAAKPLAEITKNLLVWSSSLLPKVSENLGKVLQDFSAWLDEAIRTGKLDAALKLLGETLKDIWRTVKGFGGVMQAIASAAQAAGIAAFPLADIMERMSETMNSAPFQKGLTNFFKGAAAGSEGLKTALKPLGGLLASMEPVLSKFMAEAGGAVGNFAATLFSALDNPKTMESFSLLLTGFTKIFENMTPAVGPFVEKLGEMMRFAGVLADVVSKTLSVAIQELAPVISILLEAFEPLAIALGDLFQRGMKSAAPALKGIAKAAAGLIDGVVVFIKALDNPVIKFVTGLLVDFFATAVKGVFNLVGGVLKIVGGLMKLLSGDFSGLKDIWEGLKSGLLGAFQLFITLFAPAKILSFLKPLLKFVPKIFTQLGPKILSGLGSIFSKLGSLFMKGISALPGFFFRILESMIKKAPQAIAGIGKIGENIVKGLVRGIQALIGGAIARFVDWIIDPIKNLLGINSPSKVFMEIGRWLVEGLINGVKAIISTFVSLFSNVLNGVKAVFIGAFNYIKNAVVTSFNFYKNLIVTVLTAIKNVVSTVWNGIKTFISTALNGIKAIISTVFNWAKTFITNIWNSIKGATSAAWNGLKSVVSGAINGVKSVVKSGIDSVWNTISSLPGKILGLGGKLLSAGKNIAGKIKDGLVSGIKSIGSSAGNIAASLKSGINKALNLPKKFSFNVLGKKIGFTIPGFAKGVQNFAGGLAVVGERGPELVNLPKGSDVIPNKRSMDILNSQRSATSNVTEIRETVFAPTIHNPKEETSRESLLKVSKEMAYLGLVG